MDYFRGQNHQKSDNFSMRLRQLQNLIETTDLDALVPEQRRVGSSDVYRYFGLIEYREAVKRLAMAPAFDGITKELLEFSIFATALDSYDLGSSESDSFDTRTKLLQMAARGLLLAITHQLAKQEPDSLTIKLPESLNLRTVVDDLNTIEKALSQVVLDPSLDGRVDVVTWEPGSLWIEIFLGTSAATVVAGSIAWAAAVISKKRNESRIIEQHVESLQLKNEMLRNLCDAHKEMLDLQIESESKAILKETRPDPERLARIQYAIKEFSTLIDRGAEVHPALNAPESVKNLFPGMISPIAIDSRIHKLENSSSGES
jgi:hypothetical protein